MGLLLDSFYRTDTIRAILAETGIVGGSSLCTLWWALTYHFEIVGLCKVKVPWGGNSMDLESDTPNHGLAIPGLWDLGIFILNLLSSSVKWAYNTDHAQFSWGSVYLWKTQCLMHSRYSNNCRYIIITYNNKLWQNCHWERVKMFCSFYFVPASLEGPIALNGLGFPMLPDPGVPFLDGSHCYWSSCPLYSLRQCPLASWPCPC